MNFEVERIPSIHPRVNLISFLKVRKCNEVGGSFLTYRWVRFRKKAGISRSSVLITCAWNSLGAAETLSGL